MNFNFYLLKSFRIFLFPFSLVYGLGVEIRNYLYDKNVLTSTSFPIPVVCVGNLVAGGTGKSPMVEYLLSLLTNDFNLATLSRGYKRSTKGYLLATANTTTYEIGDEPMQFHKKFANVAVAVGENRVAAIPQLLLDRPETGVIILDDAFQHRSVKAGLNILLTEHGNLFTRDFFLPTGDLRDERLSYKRADIIVVTKCPENLSKEACNFLQAEIKPLPHQQLFFTTISYGIPYHIITKQAKQLSLQDEVLLVCGIANPEPLKQYVAQNCSTYYQQLFPDHHRFTSEDIRLIVRKYAEIETKGKIIITTEKDAVRLGEFQAKLGDIPLYILPVQHSFLFGEGSHFNKLIHTFIDTFQGEKNKHG